MTQTRIRMVTGNACTGSYTDAAGEHLFPVNARGFNAIAVPGANHTYFNAISVAGTYVTGNYTLQSQPNNYALAFISDGASYATLPPLAARGSAVNNRLEPSAVSDTGLVAGTYIANNVGGVFVSNGKSTTPLALTLPAGFGECIPQSYTTDASAMAFDCIADNDPQQIYVQVNGTLLPIKLPPGDSGYPLNSTARAQSLAWSPAAICRQRG